MHFRLGVNPQHVRGSKKGRSNPSGETTLAIMGIAEERTEGARIALGRLNSNKGTKCDIEISRSEDLCRGVASAVYEPVGSTPSPPHSRTPSATTSFIKRPACRGQAL
jgi:hypothetical protein